MRARSWCVLATSACVVLSACGKKEPSGQVAATVDGTEVTTTELNNELSGFTAPTPQIRKEAERAALDQILARKVLAKAATKAGIDKTPGFAQKEQRLHDELLVQSWQEAIAKTVPTPSREEVEKFMADHPEVYANHKVYDVEQIRTVKPADPAVLKGLAPLNTMQDVASFLTQHNVDFRSGADRLDSLAIDPDIVDRIEKLAPNELFVVPAGNLVVINRITGSQVVPVPPDLAFKQASQVLKAKRTKEAIGRKFQSELAAAKKDIKYNKEFQPAPPAAPAKAGAPAPAAKAK